MEGMTVAVYKASLGPLELSVSKPDKLRLPARWWSPQRTHLRLLPGVVLSLPRRWMPHRNDGYRLCGFCYQTRWLEGGGGNGACEECRRTLRCVTSQVKGPPWWPDRLARLYKETTGEEWRS
jgi:hypothetical protein